jgi:hypothetical protein
VLIEIEPDNMHVPKLEQRQKIGRNGAEGNKTRKELIGGQAKQATEQGRKILMPLLLTISGGACNSVVASQAVSGQDG